MIYEIAIGDKNYRLELDRGNGQLVLPFRRPECRS
jgi:hypothetical protein